MIPTLRIDFFETRPWWAPWRTLHHATWRYTRPDGSYVVGTTARYRTREAADCAARLAASRPRTPAT